MFYGKRRETRSRVIGVSLPQRVRLRPVVDCQKLRSTSAKLDHELRAREVGVYRVDGPQVDGSEASLRRAQLLERGRSTRRVRALKHPHERAVWRLILQDTDSSR